MTELSTCCNAPEWLFTGLCSACNEHTEFYDDDVIYCPECDSKHIDLLGSTFVGNVETPEYFCEDCYHVFN